MAGIIAKNKNISKLFFLKNKNNFTVLIWAALFLFTTFFCVLSIAGLKINQYITEIPTKESIKAVLQEKTQNSKILDRNGSLLYVFKNPYQDREYVEFADIPSTVILAALAAEDKDFFIHSGIDYLATANGVLTTVFSGGEQKLGGSTITQQLVKQTVLNSQQTIERKAKEAIITTVIENDFSKEQILEYYLNTSSFGGRVIGIKTAATAYFNKTLEQLTLNEAAFLVGLVRSPGEYSPLFASNTEQALTAANIRRNFVLEQILANNRLLRYWQTKDLNELKRLSVPAAEVTTETKAAVVALTSQQLVVNPAPEVFRAPHWVFYVRDTLAQSPYNLSLDELYNGGYTIHTSLDIGLQEIAEQEVANGVASLGWRYRFQNAGLVTVSAETGEILAMAGSKGYNFANDPGNKAFDPKVNVTTSLQPLGSSLKPFVAYLAFENGMSPWTVVSDSATTFAGGYRPKNADGRFYGDMTIRQALLLSRNLPFLKISDKVGFWQLPDLMRKIGYRTDTQYGLAATIGGVDETLLAHTAAYTGLANGGQVMQLKPVLKITDSEGKDIFNAHTQVKFQLNPRSVGLVNAIIGDKSYRAGGHWAKFIGSQKLAGKTGTTDRNKDNLFVGYGPKVVTGIWVGNNDNSELAGNAYGLNTALPIWNAYMRRVFAVAPWLGVNGRY